MTASAATTAATSSTDVSSNSSQYSLRNATEKPAMPYDASPISPTGEGSGR
jgi:hypothetical protein